MKGFFEHEATRLRVLIEASGLSQRGVSARLGISDRDMRYWCAGKYRPPNMVFLALERLIQLKESNGMAWDEQTR